MRTTAREIFQRALEESSIERAFVRNLHYENGVLQAGENRYELGKFSSIFVVSFGKGAHSTLEALMTRIGGGTASISGIVCAPTLPKTPVAGFRYFEGGHPMPNQESMRAAEAILRALESLDERALVIYLISGGGSAIVEKPISDAITFEDLVQTYRALVHSGAPIALINAVRKHISAVKGGRMAMAASPAQQLSIMISDVPDNALDSLASGATMPDTSTVAQCYEIVEKYNLLPQLPPSVRELFEAGLKETPKAGDPIFEHARWWPILSNVSARDAAVKLATEKGFTVEVDNTCDDWDYRKAGDYLLERVRELRKKAARVCLISGGEITVKVDAAKPGVGGRNVQIALYWAERIQGENIAVLSAGTDGIDGNSPAAGSVADGTTMARAAQKGLSAEAALNGFDAYPFFDALGDTIMTGYTGTNVRDVRVLLAW